MDYILKTRKLKKYYGKFKALDGLTMNVPKGSIYGFVGKNGAGKTTLIRLVCGLQYQTGGKLKLYNVKHDDKKINDIRKKMGVKPGTNKYIQNELCIGYKMNASDRASNG